MRGFAEHLIGFPIKFNKFSNTGARMQDSIYHDTKLAFCYTPIPLDGASAATAQ